MSDKTFVDRHIGPNQNDKSHMLAQIGASSMENLIKETVPANILRTQPLDLPAGISEHQALDELSSVMSQNTVHKSFIGQGYHNCHVPPVILRNMFENPAWYTAYTPYQAEISQGRLEMLFHFQTLVSELTGLPIASASLLDEATAVSEAIGVAYRHHREKRNKVCFAGRLHPQTLDVVATRGKSMDLDICDTVDDKTCALVVAWPDTSGAYGQYDAQIEAAKKAGALVIAVADPLALTLVEAPGKWGADIAVGTMQRFGVPLGYGGPHAAYMALTEKITRLLPGRIVGQSIDAKGRAGYRLALQTREQHIRREKATSNICTAQALLANMAAAYAIWHGPSGLRSIATSIAQKAVQFNAALKAAGCKTKSDRFFDTVTICAHGGAEKLAAEAIKNGRLIRVVDQDHVSISFDEASTHEDVVALAQLFGAKIDEQKAPSLALPSLRDETGFMTQPIFQSNASETQMMRLLRRLSDKDLALDRAMIPLGSCTMKLNAAAEMAPVSWASVANMHPFAPRDQAKGYLEMFKQLEDWLSEITGFDGVSLQPNAGSQGEYAGLLAISRFHQSQGDKNRNICIIPASAHGTNPASAHMAGMDVVVVKCLEDGDIDLEDLKAKAVKYSDRLAALMVTYPSTHGVFEANIVEMCKVIHDNGGQVYLDGANLNAMVGLARPGDIGADVCHMNLHKTFCIPHGGGGPGIGPIGVKSHLIPFLPGHIFEGSDQSVAAAPYGSASILPITWMYIRMMGPDGLKNASETAILSANYIAHQLSEHYPTLFRGKNGRVAHECILDTRVLNESAGISVDDIAKRLIDYGFHAPTMSWPVAGTLMVEPTESEPLQEVNRFCDAMISIAKEADMVKQGTWPADDNPLVNAPHCIEDVMGDEWTHSYERSVAAKISDDSEHTKYWPPVSRIDNVHGDRNLVCTCPPIEDYEQPA